MNTARGVITPLAVFIRCLGREARSDVGYSLPQVWCATNVARYARGARKVPSTSIFCYGKLNIVVGIDSLNWLAWF